MYKLKIACTNRNQLNYNNKSISSKLSDEIINSSLLTENSSIERVFITYKMTPKKNGAMFTSKSLEILSNHKFTIKQVKKIIKNMRENGFSSQKNVPVQFIDTNTNDVLYMIGFHDGNKKMIPDKGPQYKNISKYFTKNMWIRNK